MPMVVPIIAGAVAVGSAIDSATEDDIKYKANDPYKINRNAADSGYNAEYEKQNADYQKRRDEFLKKNPNASPEDIQRMVGNAPIKPPTYEDKAMAGYSETANRQAQTMQAAQLGPAAQGTAAQIAANERTANQNIGQTQNVNAAQLGNAAQMNGAVINRQDNEGRAGQQRLIGALEEQAAGRGPSMAKMQMQDAQDRAAKQGMSMAASMKGGQSAALAQRNALNMTAQGNQQGARDAAQLRVQEQFNAQNALGNQLGNLRGADIGVNTSQAGFMQDASGRNMDSNNQFAMQNANLSQQANMYNSQAFNQRQMDQASMNMQNSQFNANNTNQYNNAQAGFNQQMGLSNLGFTNQFAIQQAQMQQQANANNLQSAVTNQAQKDAQQQYYMSQANAINEANAGRRMTMEQMYTNQDMGFAVQDQKAYEAAQQAKERNVDRVIGGLEKVGEMAGMAGASDERGKKNITDGSSAVSGSDSPIQTSGGGGYEPESAGVKQKGGFKKFSSHTTVKVPGSSEADSTPDWNALAGNSPDGAYQAPRRTKPQPSQLGDNPYEDLTETSDERCKKESYYSENDTRDLLDLIHAHKYRYKDPDARGAGEGEFISPMAQELEKSKLGKNMVIEDDDGNKMVDYGKGFGFLMASMATLNEDIAKLKKKRKTFFPRF